jgi:hypothetical protein
MTQEMRLLSVEQLRFVSDTAYGAGVRASQDELRRLEVVNAQLLEALRFIADRQDLMFAECSDAEEIIEVARAAIAAAKDSNAA